MFHYKNKDKNLSWFYFKENTSLYFCLEYSIGTFHRDWNVFYVAFLP